MNGIKCFLLFLCFFCVNCELETRTEDYVGLSPHYQNFNKMVSKVVQNSKRKCGNYVVPAGHIYVRTISELYFENLLIQREGMELRGVRECLESLFVTVAFDRESLELCAYHDVPNCVMVHHTFNHTNRGHNTEYLTGRDVVKRDFYWFEVYDHQIILATIMHPEVVSMCYFDSDIMILDLPSRYFDVTAYDVQYQQAGGVPNQCLEGGFNGGLVCLRRTQKAIDFMNRLVKEAPQFLDGAKADVDDAIRFMEEVGASRCNLPYDSFTGYCAARPGLMTRNLVAIHANCRYPPDKWPAMRSIIDQVKSHKYNENFEYVF